MKTSVRSFIVWAVVCASLLAGCNVFDGLGGEGESEDPEVLLQDARAALSRGEPEAAVRYLERAYSLDPTNPEVRIELVGARFARAELDLITLQQLVDDINGEADNGETDPPVASARRHEVAHQEQDGFCTFDEDRSSLEEFDYTASSAYQSIQVQIDTFRAARDLLDGIRPVVLNSLPDRVQAQWYLTRAFTRVALAVSAVNEEVEQIDATLYRLPSLQNSIGICASSEQALSEAEVQIKCDHLPKIVRALDELEMRNQLLDNPDISGVLDDLRLAVDVVGAQLDSDVIRFCSGGAAVR